MFDSPKVTTIENADAWTVDNRYLYYGYRKNIKNFKETLHSLFTPHNELLNIWTHFLGALIFVFFMLFLFAHVSESQIMYQKLREQFHNSDFLKSIYSHSKSVSNYLKTIDLDAERDAFQIYLIKLKNDYMLKYETIKNALIEEEELIIRNVHQKLAKTINLIEDVFDKISEKLQFLARKTDFNFEKWNDEIGDLLQINQVVAFIDRIFMHELEFYPVVIYMICAIACMSLSAIFHSFFILNKTICKILQKCDYAGTVIMIFGSSYAFFFYNFYCFPFWNYFYAIILAIFSISCFITSLSDYVDREEGKKFLGLLMGGLGLSNIFPLIHILFLRLSPVYSADMFSSSNLIGFPITGVLYLSGLAIYISKFPEKFYPKKFDIWFNSHTIWHIFVFFGALSHYWSVLHVYHIRKSMTCIN